MKTNKFITKKFTTKLFGNGKVKTKSSKEHIKYNFRQHQHKKYKINLEINKKLTLKDFIVLPNVLRPEKFTALSLARLLYKNRKQYKNKVIIDMGCGTGIQGVTAALIGAKKVIFSDISPVAVRNTKANIKKFKIKSKSIVYKGDLFQKIKKKADIIVFNHPFYTQKLSKKRTHIAKSIMADDALIHNFFVSAKKHLKRNGLIIMPYFLSAGKKNNPAAQCVKHGYQVVVEHKVYPKGRKKTVESVFEMKL